MNGEGSLLFHAAQADMELQRALEPFGFFYAPDPASQKVSTIGGNIGPEMERFDEAKLILLWGTNPITSSVHLWTRVTEAKRRGAKVIAIDPYRSLTAAKCDQHIAPLRVRGQHGLLHCSQSFIALSRQCRSQRRGDTLFDHVFS